MALQSLVSVLPLSSFRFRPWILVPVQSWTTDQPACVGWGQSMPRLEVKTQLSAGGFNGVGPLAQPRSVHRTFLGLCPAEQPAFPSYQSFAGYHLPPRKIRASVPNHCPLVPMRCHSVDKQGEMLGQGWVGSFSWSHLSDSEPHPRPMGHTFGFGTWGCSLRSSLSGV